MDGVRALVESLTLSDTLAKALSDYTNKAMSEAQAISELQLCRWDRQPEQGSVYEGPATDSVEHFCVVKAC